jgi:hypothetical protein
MAQIMITMVLHMEIEEQLAKVKAKVMQMMEQGELEEIMVIALEMITVDLKDFRLTLLK